MKHLLFLIFVMNGLIFSHAQVKPLTVNDVFPSGLRAKNVANFPTETIDFADYNGKNIILDFWATTCGSCISNMPKMAALQKQYNHSLLILHITKQSKKEVEAFYEKRKDLKELGLPIIAADTLFSRLFPYVYIPHIIWINKNGIIKAITHGEEITEENIQAFTGGADLVLQTKKDLPDYDFNASLVSSDAPDKNILFSSVISKYKEGIGTRESLTFPTPNSMRVFASNEPLLSLYYFAWQFKLSVLAQQYQSRVILTLSDSTKHPELFSGNKYYERNHRYCYEGRFERLDASANKEELLAYMQYDLDRTFNLKSAVKKVKTVCYVLSTKRSISTKAASLGNATADETVNSIKLINQSGASIAAHIPLYYNDGIPLISDVATSLRFNITLRKYYSSLENLQEDLDKAGLIIRKNTRKIEMLVLSDRL